jgi:hypothetical protein
VTLALDRIEIESVGADPVRLAAALLRQLPELDAAVPIGEIARALDIGEIVERPLASIEGCLQCDALKSRGQIVVNARSSRRRQRFTIAHELGHFLNERHRPTSAFGFDCTAEDMAAPRRDGARLRQEREANTFAIELLTPRAALARHLMRSADLEHAIGLGDRFDISREAAIRRYVALHRETLAAVFTQNGSIRYIEKSKGFPTTTIWSGDPAPETPSRRAGDNLTSMDEADPEAWLSHPGRRALYAQTLFQADGYACTLLLAEEADDDGGEWDAPRFRR